MKLAFIKPQMKEFFDNLQNFNNIYKEAKLKRDKEKLDDKSRMFL